MAKKKKEEKSFLPLLLPSLSTDDPGRAPRGWPRALFPLPPLLCRSALRSDDLVSFSRGEEEGRGAEKAVKKIPRKSRFELDFRRPHDPRRAALSRFHFHHPQKVKERINRFFFCCERSDSGGENRGAGLDKRVGEDDRKSFLRDRNAAAAALFLFAPGQSLLPDDDAGRGGDSTCLAQGADVDQAEERRRKRRRRRERKRPGAKKEALEQGRTRKSRRRKSLEVDEDGFTVLRVREGASRGLLRDDVGPAEEAEEVAWRLSLVGVCVWRRRGKRGKRGREGERSGS